MCDTNLDVCMEIQVNLPRPCSCRLVNKESFVRQVIRIELRPNSVPQGLDTAVDKDRERGDETFFHSANYQHTPTQESRGDIPTALHTHNTRPMGGHNTQPVQGLHHNDSDNALNGPVHRAR